MGSGPESVHVRTCRALALAASSLAVLVGSFALVGWWLNIPTLTSVLPGLATMKPITATCFVLAGIALRLFIRQELSSTSRVARIVCRCCAGVVLLAGAATLAEYLLGWNLGVDELLFRSTLLSTGIAHPGRMAPATALAFLLLSAAFLLGNWQTRKDHWPAQTLALAAAFIGLIPFLGFLYSAKITPGPWAYSSMAVHTALLMVLCGTGLVLARPHSGLMAVVTSDFLGGLMVRRLLPLVTLPMLIGWVRLKGQA